MQTIHFIAVLRRLFIDVLLELTVDLLSDRYERNR